MYLLLYLLVSNLYKCIFKHLINFSDGSALKSKTCNKFIEILKYAKKVFFIQRIKCIVCCVIFYRPFVIFNEWLI